MKVSAQRTRRLFRVFSAAAVGGMAMAPPLVWGVLNPLAVDAQTPGNTVAASFEVASVKPNKSGDGRIGMGFQPGGRFTATNVTLALLVAQAYRLQGGRGGLPGRGNPLIVNAPGWMNDDRFDIVAKSDGDVPPDRLPDLIKSLVIDRFKLSAHNESREFQVYALVPARTDGKLGPALRPSTPECQATIAARGRGAPARGGPGGPDGRGPIAPPNPGEPMPCGMIRMGPGTIGAGGAVLSQLVASLTPWVDRIVVDKTGLTGPYDIDLHWTPEQLAQGGGGGSAIGAGGAPPGAPPFPAIDPNGPSIFTAVQEQLGLKLESTKAMVDVLVIDHVEPPTPD